MVLASLDFVCFSKEFLLGHFGTLEQPLLEQSHTVDVEGQLNSLFHNNLVEGIIEVYSILRMDFEFDILVAAVL